MSKMNRPNGSEVRLDAASLSSGRHQISEALGILSVQSNEIVNMHLLGERKISFDEIAQDLTKKGEKVTAAEVENTYHNALRALYSRKATTQVA